VQYTDQQKAEFRSSYAERRRRQIIASVPVIGFMIAVMFTEDRAAGTILGLPSQIMGPAFLVAVVAILAFSFRNWRCPACDKYLGRAFNPKYCGRCGVELRA